VKPLKPFRSGTWRFGKRRRVSLRVWLMLTLLVGVGAFAAGRFVPLGKTAVHPIVTPGLPAASEVGGRVLDAGLSQPLNLQQIESQVRWRYGKDTPAPKFPVTFRLVRYTSTDSNGKQVNEYARVYVPQGATTKLPMLAFSPGTTGLGDACASSLEQPLVRNLGDYQAHALALASQGIMVVIPDYEGMRDPGRLHHYMVGDLEGRAVLDAMRAASKVRGVGANFNGRAYLAGYSQGGQAAAFADQIAPTYAPDLKIAGYIAYAPVSDVKRTWQDILHGSSLDWFGPYVLTSYSDYYSEKLDINQVLLPKWTAHLTDDVVSHCIDSAPHFWGTKPDQIYTSGFLAALNDGQLTNHGFSTLAAELSANSVLGDTTATPKLLVQGGKDNVILPAQTKDFKAKLCQNRAGAVHQQDFPDGDHYTIPVLAFQAVWQWVQSQESGQSAPTDCQV
jgi:hypothetical protein